MTFTRHIFIFRQGVIESMKYVQVVHRGQNSRRVKAQEKTHSAKGANGTRPKHKQVNSADRIFNTLLDPNVLGRNTPRPPPLPPSLGRQHNSPHDSYGKLTGSIVPVWGKPDQVNWPSFRKIGQVKHNTRRVQIIGCTISMPPPSV